MRETTAEYYARIKSEYRAIPVEDRLLGAKVGLDLTDAKIARLERERDSGCSTAWLSRRQLPAQYKMRRYQLMRIAECEAEMSQCQTTSRP